MVRDSCRREGRSSRPLEDKGVSKWRRIKGTKLGFVLNHKEN